MAWCAFCRRQRFEVKGLGVPDDLNPLMREVLCESGQHQPGAVDGGLMNDAFESLGAGGQAQLQGTGVFGVKPFNGDGIVLHEGNVKREA